MMVLCLLEDSLLSALLGISGDGINLLHAVKDGDEDKVKFYLDSQPGLVSCYRTSSTIFSGPFCLSLSPYIF